MDVKFINCNSVLLINPLGKIRRLFTPFKVVCIESINGIPFNTLVFVDEVLNNDQDQLLYQINGGLYLYKHFQITAKF